MGACCDARESIRLDVFLSDREWLLSVEDLHRYPPTTCRSSCFCILVGPQQQVQSVPVLCVSRDLPVIFFSLAPVRPVVCFLDVCRHFPHTRECTTLWRAPHRKHSSVLAASSAHQACLSGLFSSFDVERFAKGVWRTARRSKQTAAAAVGRC